MSSSVSRCSCECLASVTSSDSSELWTKVDFYKLLLSRIPNDFVPNFPHLTPLVLPPPNSLY